MKSTKNTGIIKSIPVVRKAWNSVITWMGKKWFGGNKRLAENTIYLVTFFVIFGVFMCISKSSDVAIQIVQTLFEQLGWW